MSKRKKIYVAGHAGMVGSAICKMLNQDEDLKIITRTRRELDLLNQSDVSKFLDEERPDEVVLAAAKVGGIIANKNYPAQFIYENLTIQNNIIHQAHSSGVQKLIFLGSSCIYPRNTPQPIEEKSLLSGRLEKSNESYAIAKIAR